MALPLPREVREGLETFAIPLRLMSGAGFMVAAICLAPALIMPNKTVAKEFAAVGRTGAIASLLAAVPGIAIGIVLNKDSENILTSLEAATRVEPSISRAADFDGCSPATSGHIVSEMVALFQQPGDSVKKPAACVDCQHYDGHSYGGNPFICAMHPYGWDTEQCPDWEGQRTCFRIVRIQGADRPALYLIKPEFDVRKRLKIIQSKLCSNTGL